MSDTAESAAIAGSDVYYDTYSREIATNPYPTYRRLREEAPVYYNPEYNFYALSRYEDVRQGLGDHETFSSARGGILEIIQNDIQLPAGTFIFEDPPQHTAHRAVVQRIFAPRRMLGLEDKVREITVNCLDQLIGRDEFDFIGDIGTQIPMRVIGVLLGIPEEDFDEVRETVDAAMRTEEGKPKDYDGALNTEDSFIKYIEMREQNPSDDIISELLGVEFTDETGTTRKLTHEELVTFFNVLAGAGNETTNKLIGWTAKLLAEHPEQRRQLVEDPSRCNEAIEEILRFEPPGPHIARYVTKDVEFHGQTIPAGSAVVLINASANRDDSAFPNGDTFDINRERTAAHISFGYGIHTCIGQVLARMEGRIVLEEVLKRFPEWDIDFENAELLSTSTVRGWATLPAYLNEKGLEKIRARKAEQAAAEQAKADEAPESIDGEWVVTVKGPTGPMDSNLVIETVNGALSGAQTGEGTTTPIDNIDYENGDITWVNKITKPMKMKLQFKGKVVGNTMSGKVKAGFMGSFPFTATKV